MEEDEEKEEEVQCIFSWAAQAWVTFLFILPWNVEGGGRGDGETEEEGGGGEGEGGGDGEGEREGEKVGGEGGEVELEQREAKRPASINIGSNEG